MRLGALLRTKLVDPILKAQGSPESIARGGAMGMWVALTPTVGVQMAAVVGLAVPLRANVPVAIAMVWISNPITVVPLYFAFYWLGSLLLGTPGQSYMAVAGSMRDAFEMVPTEGLLAALSKLGSEVLWPMTVGSLVIASAAAVPTYHILLRLARRRLERKLLAGLEAGELEIVEEGLERRPKDAPRGRDGLPLPQPGTHPEPEQERQP